MGYKIMSHHGRSIASGVAIAKSIKKMVITDSNHCKLLICEYCNNFRRKVCDNLNLVKAGICNDFC